MEDLFLPVLLVIPVHRNPLGHHVEVDIAAGVMYAVVQCVVLQVPSTAVVTVQPPADQLQPQHLFKRVHLVSGAAVHVYLPAIHPI